MLLIVGLGNVGAQYESTYHNAGFMVLDELAKTYGFSFSKTKHNSMYADAKISGQKVVFLKPKTYMNNSGIAVQSAMKKFKLNASQLLVVYDDIDIAVGTIRARKTELTKFWFISIVMYIFIRKLLPRFHNPKFTT